MSSEVQRLGELVAELTDRLTRLERQPMGLGYSSFDSGGITQYLPGTDIPGSKFGQQYDGSNGIVALTGPTPPTPRWTHETGAEVTEVIGGLLVRWEGYFEPDNTAVASIDHKLVEVHASETPDLSGLLFDTLRSTITSARGGQVFLPLPTSDSGYYIALVARSVPGKTSARSAVLGPFHPQKIEILDLGFDPEELGGNRISRGPDEPTGGNKYGDLWLKTPENIAYQWTPAPDRWESVRDEGVVNAIDAAFAAQNAVDSKARVFVQASAPVGLTAADTNDLWIDSDANNATYTWSGTAWEPRQISNESIKPNSLVASDVVATGTITAALFRAIMVLTNTMVVGDPAGNRITISGAVNSTAGIGIQQVTNGQVTFNLDPSGNTYFAGVLSGRSANFQEATSGWRLEDDGDFFAQNVQVGQSISARDLSVTNLTVSGRSILDLIGDRSGGLVAQGFNDTINLQGVVGETGIVELGFTAYPGRGYRISVNGGAFAASDQNTVVGWLMRYTTNGSAPNVNSPMVAPLGHQTVGPTNEGQYISRAIQKDFLWYPIGANTAPTPIRIALSFYRERGSGSVGCNCTGIRIQMSASDEGQALPNSIRVNNFTAAAPPPPPAPPVQAYEETFYSTWTASYRQNGTRWQENASMYQGYGDSFNGNQGSMAGFNLAQMRGRLAGSRIVWAKAYFRNQHTWNQSGGAAWLGSHGNDAMPATWGGPAFTERFGSVGTAKGGWFEADVTNWANWMRDATTSGLLLGRAPDNNSAHYGYWYGQNSADRPRVVVRFEK